MEKHRPQKEVDKSRDKKIDYKSWNLHRTQGSRTAKGTKGNAGSMQSQYKSGGFVQRMCPRINGAAAGVEDVAGSDEEQQIPTRRARTGMHC
jgi:hypothetical protein